MSNLIGVHDLEGIKLTPADTWILSLAALSENPAPINFNPAYHHICRVGWGYGSTGTIPKPDKDTEFLFRLSNYVQRSTGNRRWIIGNECNLPREWPDNQSIHPFRYAEFFTKCADVIHAISGHEKDEVLIAGSGPWNDQYRYAGNISGDWIKYFTDCIGAIPKEKIGGFSIHSYTHGYNRHLVMSEAMMNAPFQNRHFEFRTYRDYCIAVPESLAHLPIYLTEANGDGPWQAVGLMQEMAREIDYWNEGSESRKIKCLIFYRYPKYDSDIKFNIQGKLDVEQEYLATVALGLKSPELPNKILLPEVKAMPPEKSLFTTTVTAELLNVRNRPGVSGTLIVGNRAKGASVEVYEEREVDGSKWYRIGRDQWINATYTVKGWATPAPPTNNFSRSLAFILRWEGLYADHPNDPGGATMKGITLGTYTQWRKEKNLPAPTKDQLRNIPDSEVAEIYYQRYWLPSKANTLAWPLCLAHMDTAVNAGVGKAQEMLVKSKGDFELYVGHVGIWYTTLNNFEHFGRAWARRRFELLLEAKK
jgi:hypothetical protein